MTDLLAGRIDMFFIGTQIALPQVQAGKLRALALTGAKRWKGMPDVPTMQEAGLQGLTTSINWFGAWLPAGAPPEIVARLHAEIARALQEPDVQQAIRHAGPARASDRAPEEFARFVAKEAATIAGDRPPDRRTQEMSGTTGRSPGSGPRRTGAASSITCAPAGRCSPKRWTGGARCAVALLLRLRPRDQRAARRRRVDRASCRRASTATARACRASSTSSADTACRRASIVPAVAALLYPDEQRRVVAEGHEVGIHGWIHERNSVLPLDSRARPADARGRRAGEGHRRAPGRHPHAVVGLQPEHARDHARDGARCTTPR